MIQYSLDEKVDTAAAYLQVVSARRQSEMIAPLMRSISVNFVRPGDVLLKYQDISEAPTPGGGVTHSEQGRVLKASEYGYVNYGDEVTVYPLIMITEDKVAGFMLMPDLTLVKRPLSLLDLMHEIEGRKFWLDIDRDLIRQEYENAKKGTPSMFLFIKGSKPRDVTSTEIKLHPALKCLQRSTVGCDFDSDEFSFNSMPIVKAGSVIGSIIPAKPGMDGKDIYGEPIVHKTNNQPNLILGPGIIKDANGLSIVAKTSGVVSISDKTILLSQVKEFKPSQISSPITLEESVVVHGDISGVEISSKGAIIVLGSISSSKLRSELGTFIKSFAHSSQIISTGDVKAFSIKACAIAANGRVSADECVENSTVKTNGILSVSSNTGRIFGGKIMAGLGVVAANVGKEGVQTLIVLGDTTEIKKKLFNYQQKDQDNNEILKKFLGKLGPSFVKNPAKFMSSVPPEKKETVKILLKEYRNIMHEQRILRSLIGRLKQYIDDAETARLTVSAVIEPSCVLSIREKSFNINERKQSVELYLNDTYGEIVEIPLS